MFIRRLIVVKDAEEDVALTPPRLTTITYEGFKNRHGRAAEQRRHLELGPERIKQLLLSPDD